MIRTETSADPAASTAETTHTVASGSQTVPPAPPVEPLGTEAGAPDTGDRSVTWNHPGLRYGYLALVTSLTFAADLATKELVKRTMAPGEVIPVIPPFLDLHYITNRGVAFGLFSRFGDLFIPVAIVIMLVILGYYRSLRQRRLWLRTALGLQLGGALGNLLDRFRYGAVIDFIDFHIEAINFHWPVFNVADSAIVIGVGILLACLTFQPDR